MSIVIPILPLAVLTGLDDADSSCFLVEEIGLKSFGRKSVQTGSAL